jgi:LacI family transcriptional regulator of maltose regulon
MVFLTQGAAARRCFQRFDTLLAQGVDGVIVAGAIDVGELRERAAEACRWCLLPAPATSTMST